MDNPVMNSFLLYLVWIAFPLLPAMLIYKTFPDTHVGATGLLGSLKINATGAFAAYLIVSMLGFFIIKIIQGNITNSSYQTWEVTAQLQYVDKNDKPFSDQDKRVQQTHISVQPFIMNQTADYVTFRVTGKGREIHVNFSSTTDNFDIKSFNLEKLEKKNDANVDEAKRKIDLGLVTIHEISSKYNVSEQKREDTDLPPDFRT